MGRGEAERDGGWEETCAKTFAISKNLTKHPNLTSYPMYHYCACRGHSLLLKEYFSEQFASPLVGFAVFSGFLKAATASHSR